MATATTTLSERRVHCDVSELTNVPVYDGGDVDIALKGSAGQVKWAASIREDKLMEWCPDLPEHVAKALLGIADSTWWIANKDKDSSNIGWPLSWTVESTRNPVQQELGQPSSLKKSQEKVTGTIQPVDQSDVETFDQFARKACRSPELSYLAMMALLYRQTRDPKVLEKFQTARDNVQGHLDAIDEITNCKQ